MAKAPSAETQLRTLKRELAAYRESNARISRENAEYLRRATKAEQEVAEWKQRFDLLLSKCRDVSITEGEVQTVQPMKVAAYATLKDHLHTFEDVEDMKAFTRANNFSQAGYIDGHEHHPRKA